MSDEYAQLGAVQETLFIPLAGRARESGLSRPLLRDPKAAEMVTAIGADMARYDGGWGWLMTVLRTAIFDAWVAEFLADSPAGTVVELGTGLNTRFDRLDNGTVRWFDLDLPDTIELRRRFFTDCDRRRMLATSILDEDWLEIVRDSPGPYFFVADGVLVYLPEQELMRTFRRIVADFPGALLAFDTYPGKTHQRQHALAARRGLDARWQWACEDPRSLAPLGLEVLESTTVARPPRAVRDRLTLQRRLTLTLSGPLISQTHALTLFRALPLNGGSLRLW
jgi:O-methyltransferase involved in polyketide biosynthesis